MGATGSCHVRRRSARGGLGGTDRLRGPGSSGADPPRLAPRAVRWYGPYVRALLAIAVLVLAAVAMEVLITLVAKA